MKISNVAYNILLDKSFNLFIFALGYESRSFYLIDELRENGTDIEEIFCVHYVDNLNENILKCHSEYLKDIESVMEISYGEKNNANLVVDQIKDKLRIIKQKNNNPIRILFDYSSVSRSLYSNLPELLSELISKEDELYLSYTQGKYYEDSKHYSTASMNDVTLFSGNPSPNPNFRTHIMGLGYNTIRTQAIRCVLNPSILICCYAYPSNNDSIKKNIFLANKEIIESSILRIGLPISDFKFMISKLIEIVKDMNNYGDVVLVPDGPKPLIMAFSLIPRILDYKTGIVCLHVKSNNIEPIDIESSGSVSCFCIKL